jgi:restriction endonuclease/sigma-70-like protein
LRHDDRLNLIVGLDTPVREGAIRKGAAEARVLEGLRELTEDVLSTLTPREKKIVKMRFGLDESGRERSVKEVASHFHLADRRIRQIEGKVLAKLRHPSRSWRLRAILDQISKPTSADLREVVETVRALTPELIIHLQSHENDLRKIDPLVFEHLVAEFLKQRGFKEVRLVGKDPNTSADIYAVQKENSIGISLRYFVEVKRDKNKIGVDVINEVHGAMNLERARFGWNAALIVSVVGFKEFRKITRRQLGMMGIHLKDERDLHKWLREYQLNNGRLWLPNPPRKLP